MRNVLKASDWQFVVGSKKEGVVLELGRFTVVDLEVRSSEPVVLSALTPDGEIVFLDTGRVVSFSGELVGFQALHIVSDAFCYRCGLRANHEQLDPTPAVVHVARNLDPVQVAVQEALRAQLWKLQEEGLVTDEAFQELLQDLEEGDLEFDPEIDEFGLGHTEMEPDPAPSSKASSPEGGDNSEEAEQDENVEDKVDAPKDPTRSKKVTKTLPAA